MEPSTALGSPEGLGVLGAPGSQDTHGSESCRGQKGLISRKSLGGQRRGQWGREGGSGRDRVGGAHKDTHSLATVMQVTCPWAWHDAVRRLFLCRGWGSWGGERDRQGEGKRLEGGGCMVGMCARAGCAQGAGAGELAHAPSQCTRGALGMPQAAGRVSLRGWGWGVTTRGVVTTARSSKLHVCTCKAGMRVSRGR